MLVEVAPQHYFVPPYVGYLGWLGVYLDRKVGGDEIAGGVEDAYLTVTPKNLIDAARIRRN